MVETQTDVIKMNKDQHFRGGRQKNVEDTCFNEKKLNNALVPCCVLKYNFIIYIIFCIHTSQPS